MSIILTVVILCTLLPAICVASAEDTIAASDEICGLWQGYYTGTSNGTLVERNVDFYTDEYTESGDIEGVFEFYTDDSKGIYHYTGTIDLSDNTIIFKGDYWIANPGSYSYAEFEGTVDFNANAITGFCGNDSEKIFEFSKQSDEHISTILYSSEIAGTWSGSYTGSSSGNHVVRNITVYISDCDTAGNIEGTLIFNTQSDITKSGAYEFDGSYNYSCGIISFKGDTWIDNPGGFNLSKFIDFSVSDNKISGFVGADSSEPFELERISNSYEIKTIDKDKIPTDWVGEYDGYSGSTVVRRIYKIVISNIDDDGNLSGTAYISPKEGTKYPATGSYKFEGTLNFITKK